MATPFASSQFTQYDPFLSSGSRTGSAADLNSYPTAQHHLSGGPPDAPYRSSMEPRDMQQAEASPFLVPAGSSPSFNSHPNPSSRVGLTSLGDEARRSQTSMIGLGSTPPEPQSTWLQKEVKHQKRNKLLFISACVGILAIIALAIGLGVYFGTKHNNVNASNSNSNNSSTQSSPDDPTLQDPNDPSNFAKDPNLKNSFYGIAYTARDALYPSCNQTLTSTILDIQLLSQITTRIRLYGSDCNQTALVLEAIKQTKTNVKVFPAIFVVDKDDAAYQRQKTALQEALQTYGTDNVLGITVGNEFMLNYVLEHGAANANGTVGLAASALLKTKITDIRQMLTTMNINLPVGTADAGSYFNNDLLGAVDFGMANVHAWFAGTTVQAAADWTFTFFKETNVDVANALANKPQMYIAETGWPTYSSTVEDRTNNASDASEPNLQIFINTFVCTANTQSVKYFFFEFTDVPWKERLYPGVEGFWGLFYGNKTLKALTLPDCSHD